MTRLLLAVLVLAALATWKLRRDAAVWRSFSMEPVPLEYDPEYTHLVRRNGTGPHTGVRDPHLERLR